jgi:hypothetical protein
VSSKKIWDKISFIKGDGGRLGSVFQRARVLPNFRFKISDFFQSLPAVGRCDLQLEICDLVNRIWYLEKSKAHSAKRKNGPFCSVSIYDKD